MSVENEQIKALIKVLNAGSPTNGQEDTEKRIAELLHAADDTTMEELLRNTHITTHVLLDALMRESLARVFASRPKIQWEKLSAEHHALSILHSCGMHPDHYSDIVKAAQGAKDMIQSFRGELADPPHDVQAAVLRKLGVEGYTGNEAPTCRIVAIESEQNPLSYPGIKLAGDGKYHGKPNKPSIFDCECKGWCRDGRDMISPHHPHCEHYTPPEKDPRFAKFGVAMWKFITDMGGDFCGQEINQGEHASETELSRLSKWNEALLRLSIQNEELTVQRDGAFALIEYAGELLGVAPQEHKSAHGFKVLQAIKDLIEANRQLEAVKGGAKC